MGIRSWSLASPLTKDRSRRLSKEVGCGTSGLLQRPRAAWMLRSQQVAFRSSPWTSSASRPIVRWPLKEPHRTRSVGAVYSEASNYFDDLSPQANFDAILFVNHTTAASPNTNVAVACPNDMRPVVCIGMTSAVSFSLPATWGA